MKKFLRAFLKSLLAVVIGTCFLVGTAGQAKAVKVAVIDSGATKYVNAAISFTSLAADEDPLHHGTEVARLIRKRAPSAYIYMLQVCDKDEGPLKPSLSAIVKAIKWCIRNNVDIVNMSLVTRYNKEIETLIEEASVKHGIVFIAAAGNKSLTSHFAAGDDNFIRRRKKALAPAFPSSSPHVISVGGLNSRGKIAKYSHELCDVYENGDARGQKGSSFACAKVTGRVASTYFGGGLSKAQMIARLK